MKLLIDMNLSPRWIPLLRDAGWEAVHWSDVGKAEAGDAEIMAYAAAHDYVVVTHDLDFGAILAVTHGKKPSVAQIRSGDVSPKVIGRQTLAAPRHVPSGVAAGAPRAVE